MTSSFEMATTLAHTPVGEMIGMLMLAVTVGFIAGLFVVHAIGRRKRDREG
jgi:hypothetical protein